MQDAQEQQNTQDTTQYTGGQQASSQTQPSQPTAWGNVPSEASSINTGITTEVSTRPDPPPPTTPTLEPNPPSAAAAPASTKVGPPRYFSRHAGTNQFRIHVDDQPLGRILTPEESATVLSWLQSIDTESREAR